MARKAGRPGMGRVKDGKIRAAILPELKDQLEELRKKEWRRFRSVSHIIESAIGYYLHQFEAAGGKLDEKMYPDVPSNIESKFQAESELIPGSRKSPPPKKGGGSSPR